jgi:hypothetical protein
LRPWLPVLAALCFLTAPLGAANLTVLGIAPHDWYTNDLFVHDNLAFLINGDRTDRQYLLFIYDVTDPANPRVLSSTPLWNGAGLMSDMHGIYYSNGILYVGTNNDGPGFFVLNVSDPTSPRVIATVSVASGTHNMRLAGKYLYVLPNSSGDKDFWVYDVSNPAQPALVNQFELRPGGSYLHDLSIMDDIGYASMWDDGLGLIDLRDPLATPLPMLNRHPDVTTAPTYLRSLHSAWLLPDRRHVVTCHERNNTGMNLFDTQDNPIGTSPWNYQSHQASNDTTIHDVFAVGNYAYVAYYDEGVRVLDLTDPLRPIEVGSYLMPFSSFAIWVENGTVYAIDASNGLYIFDFTIPHDAPITLYAVKSGPTRGDVDMQWNYTGESQYTVRRSRNKTGLGGPGGPYDVDGATRYVDVGVIPDGSLYYYKINGPWQ